MGHFFENGAIAEYKTEENYKCDTVQLSYIVNFVQNNKD